MIVDFLGHEQFHVFVSVTVVDKFENITKKDVEVGHEVQTFALVGDF